MASEPTDRATVIAAALSSWDSDLEAVLLGTTDPGAIVRLVDGFCGEQLGDRLAEVLFYRRGVGAVFGVRLADDRRAVIKVHRPELIPVGLDGVRTVQRRLSELGLAAPKPLGEPAAFGHGIGAAEELLDVGTVRDAHHAAVRRTLAVELRRFVEAASPLLGSLAIPLAHPFDLPSDRLWPTPHDLRFDLALPGGEWIDDLARAARQVLQVDVGTRVIGHLDWRVENLRIDGSLVAIFDWDSVAACPEPALVGHTSATFTSEWADPAIDPYPSTTEMDGFVTDYEDARGSAFTADEGGQLEAARIYSLAYGARCEHSAAVRLGRPRDPGAGWASALSSVTT